jgi:hypothetical protein
MQQDPNSPFDQESLRCLFSLQQRRKMVSIALSLSKLVAILFVLLGGLVFFREFKLGDSQYRYHMIDHHFWSYSLILLLSISVMGLGGLLWFIHDYFVFDKAPLGSLAVSLFEALGRGKVDKAQRICRAIIKQTNNKDLNQLPILLSRAFSFGVSAESALNEQQAIIMAKEATPLYMQIIEAGLKTPLVYFGLATTARIEGKLDMAIGFYSKYLQMRPNDARTREIFKQCLEKLHGEDDKQALSNKANIIKSVSSKIEMMCQRCGYTEFDYESYWKEYTCKKCGWQTNELTRENR